MKTPIIISDVEKIFDSIKKIGVVAPGIDKVTYNGAIKKGLRRNYCDYVCGALQGKTDYYFSKYRQILKLKGENSIPRSLSVPCIRDRLMLKTLHEFYLSEYIKRNSFGSIIDSIQEARKKDNKLSILQLDIKSFFDDIKLSDIEKELNSIRLEKHIVKIIMNSLRTVTIDPRKNKKTIGRFDPKKEKGIPQGIIISNALAEMIGKRIDERLDLFLKAFDARHFRFVDDIVVLYNSSKIRKNDILKKVKNTLAIYGLHINQQKTKLYKPSSTLNFLGFKFTPKSISISEEAFRKKVDKIEKVIFDFSNSYHNNIKGNYDLLVWKLNNEITGFIVNKLYYSWIHYYRNVNDMTIYYKLDLIVDKIYRRSGLDLKYLKNVKSFVTARHELFNKKTSYIPNFDILYPDKKTKKALLVSTFKFPSSLDEQVSESLFDTIIQKSIYETEKDLDLKFSL